jgi:hypothetical protein
MKLPRLDFTSYVDSKGYRTAGEVPPPRRKRSLRESLEMPSAKIGASRAATLALAMTARAPRHGFRATSKAGEANRTGLI